MIARPSDLELLQSVESVFMLDKDTGGIENGFKTRHLLHHWTLSRVERLEFRSEQLPSVILKAIAPPLLGELNVYHELFNNMVAEDKRFTPLLYGYTEKEGNMWLFLEDVGSRSLRSNFNVENLNSAIINLAGIHAMFTGIGSDTALTSRAKLPVRSLHTYVEAAKLTLQLTRILVSRKVFTHVTLNHLARLENIVNNYEKIAYGLLKLPQSLVHGDCNPSNLLFKENNDRLTLVDWANAHVGPAVFDLVDLLNYATAQYGGEMLTRLLFAYRSAFEASSGLTLPLELEELYLCCQIEKKLSTIRWFGECSLRWIPSGVEAYNAMVAGLITETYELSRVVL